MTSENIDIAVAEYLRELELRLTGLPVLQRRELLADLEAHITNARVERAVSSETELLEILERLGSPEVVAAAAYEEAGMLAPREPAYAEPVLSYAGHQSEPRPLPPVAPPPDPPPVAYAGPFPLLGSYDRPQSHVDQQHFGGSPSSYPAPPHPGPAKPEAGTGARIAIAAAIVAAVFVLLGCVGGAFFMVRGGAGPAQAPISVEAPAAEVQPEVPAPTDE